MDSMEEFFETIIEISKLEKEILNKLENGHTYTLPLKFEKVMNSIVMKADKPLTGKIIYT